MRFTVNQQKALDITKTGSFLVSASAGAGKTTILVERIKRLVLEQKIDIDKFVVVTYTKLAAGEIKEKLFNTFSDTEDDFLSENKEKISTAAIGTIHSFCAELVRKYFYLVNIDPNFAILEDKEAEKMFFDAMADVFDKHYEKDENFLDLLDRFGTKRRDDGLKKTIKRIYDFSLSLPDLKSWYIKTKSESTTEKLENYIKTQIVDNCKRYRQAAEKLGGQFLKIEEPKVASYFLDLAQDISLSDKQGLTETLKNIFDFEVKTFGPSFKKSTNPVCASENFDDMVKVAEGFVTSLREWRSKTLLTQNHLSCESEEDYQKWIDMLVELTEETIEIFSEKKRESNTADFGDLEKLASKILADEKTRTEIRNYYEYVFVDEYQDTNAVQDAIMRAVARPDRMFVVGDVKQSIYGFRLGDPDIFVNRRKEYLEAGNGIVVDMNDNFRCNKDIATFVNLLFENIMTEDFGQINYLEDGRLVCDNSCCIEDKDASVVITTIINNTQIDSDDAKTEAEKTKTEAEKPKPKSLIKEVYDPSKDIADTFDSITAQGQYIAEEIKKLVTQKDENGKEILYSDIAILLRSYKNVSQSIFAQLQKNGIPAVLMRQKNGDGKEISDLLAFLKILDNPQNDYAYAQCLVGPFCRLSFNDLSILAEKITTLDGYATKGKSGALPFVKKAEMYATSFSDNISQKLNTFFELEKKYRVLSAVNTADKLLAALVRETQYEKYVLGLPFGEVRTSRLNEFLNGVIGKTTIQVVEENALNQDENASLPPDLNAVKIMSVHGAKGLEFGVVFFAGLGNKIDTTTSESNVVINKHFGIVTPFFDADSKTRKTTQKKAFVANTNVKKIMEEEMRILYVGMTRAKRKLYMISSGKGNAVCLPEDAKSLFDWVKSLFFALNSAENPDMLKGKIRQESIYFSQLKTLADNCGDKNTVMLDAKDTFEDYLKLLSIESGDAESVKNKLLQILDWEYPDSEKTALPLKVASSQLDKAFTSAKTDIEAEEGFAEEGAYIFLDLPDEVEKSRLGSAYHKIFELCDVTDPSGVSNIIQTAVKNGLLEDKVALSLKPDLIEGCLNNKQFKALIEDAKLYRELPFLTKLPYSTLFGEGSTSEIMLQGVIDLLVIKKDKAIVVDFKVSQNTSTLRQRYIRQLESYRMAAEKILKMDVEAYIFSVLDNRLIKM